MGTEDPNSLQDRVLVALKGWEADYLSRGLLDPFRTAGMSAKQLANMLRLYKPSARDADRLICDLAVAKKALKALIDSNLVESSGMQRSMSAGSKPSERFVLTGFWQRRQEALLAYEGEGGAGESDPVEGHGCRG